MSGVMSDFNSTVEFDLKTVNWETLCKLVIDENDRLNAENHRLADLVADMLVTVRTAGRLGVDVGKVEEYGRRAHELGIEVYG